jgi:EAL domain-containing protein (putative c-di-GMP-specific phosphodiesterase class I)
MGKSLQPQNAMAVRPPANTPAAAPAAGEPVTAESLGWQLRAALPPLRLHSVSLYDEQANVLWLSEGALGPDEHNLVLEAMDTLASDRSMPCYENGLEDGRVAIFLPVRAPQGELVGVAMILADLKSVGDGVLERIVSPPIRTIMQKVAVHLRASSKGGTSSAEPPAPIAVSIAPVLELTPERVPTPPRSATPAAQAAAPPTPAAHAAAKPAATSAKPAANARAATPTNAVPAAAAPVLRPHGSSAASSSAAAVASPGSGGDADLSPQAIDDILEFEIFPDVAAAAPVRPATPPATSAQPPTLEWDNSDAGLELLSENAPSLAPVEAAPAAATASPMRAAAPAKPASSATPFAGGASASIPTLAAAPAGFMAQSSVAAGASVGSVVQATAASPAAGTPRSSLATTPSAAPQGAQGSTSVSPSEVPSNTAAGSSTHGSVDPLSTTAVSLALPPAAGPTPTAVAPTPAPQVKPTNATTTTRALPSSVAAAGIPGAAGSGASSAGQTLNAPAVTGTSRALSFDPTSIMLDIQAFSKLRAGGRTRRYEVLPRVPHREANRSPAATDGLALQRLLSWLGANRAAWNLEPTSFSLNLSISTLEDQRFPQHVASCLKANGIAPDNLGFEIAEALCTQHRAQVERFMSLCDKLGCFVVIDDFSFDSSVLPLLRSKALRLVKIDPKLTSVALRDKLSQAMVVAIVQAVKVLGIHCAAKRVESQASLQWLTAIGCDLAQGPALSQVLPIESLNMPQAPATEPGKAT